MSKVGDGDGDGQWVRDGGGLSSRVGVSRIWPELPLSQRSRHLPREPNTTQQHCHNHINSTVSLSAAIMLGLFDMIVLLGWLAVSLALLVPLVGTLVRFRAHYNPKGLQLDSEGDVQPHTGPVISSFFGMLRRVYRIEVGNSHIIR